MIALNLAILAHVSYMLDLPGSTTQADEARAPSRHRPVSQAWILRENRGIRRAPLQQMLSASPPGALRLATLPAGYGTRPAGRRKH